MRSRKQQNSSRTCCTRDDQAHVLRVRHNHLMPQRRQQSAHPGENAFRSPSLGDSAASSQRPASLLPGCRQLLFQEDLPASSTTQ
jgi:hypothetical protein